MLELCYLLIILSKKLAKEEAVTETKEDAEAGYEEHQTKTRKKTKTGKKNQPTH